MPRLGLEVCGQDGVAIGVRTICSALECVGNGWGRGSDVAVFETLLFWYPKRPDPPIVQARGGSGVLLAFDDEILRKTELATEFDWDMPPHTGSHVLPILDYAIHDVSYQIFMLIKLWLSTFF